MRISVLRRRPTRAAAVVTLVAFFVSSTGGAWIATARASAREDLVKAQEHFEYTDYAQAMAVVDKLLAEGSLSGGDLREAHILRARCLAGMGREPEAIEAFCQVVRLDPKWKPDPFQFKSEEQDLFQRAEQRCASMGVTRAEPPAQQEEAKKGGGKWKLLVAGGALLVGGVVLLAAGGGGGGDGATPDADLPGFPSPPNR